MKYILIILVFLVGCGEGDVDGYMVEAAIKGCASHGGIHHIYDDVNARHAMCNDGTRIMHLEQVK